MQRPFSQVDVFASGGFAGNPVAVVHDADGITTEEMLEVVAWTNLSEATFLLPPTDGAADYRVRIFCPGRELPFAGHPTLGSCMAWLHAGGRPARSGTVRQECGVGIVEIDLSGERPAFIAPPTRVESMAVHDKQDIMRALEIEEAQVRAAVTRARSRLARTGPGAVEPPG